MRLGGDKAPRSLWRGASKAHEAQVGGEHASLYNPERSRLELRTEAQEPHSDLTREGPLGLTLGTS